MTSRQFEDDNRDRWDRLEAVIEAVRNNQPHEDGEKLPVLLRQICHDLSVARFRLYDGELVERLNQLAIDGYRVIESKTTSSWEGFARMILRDFPQLVRAEKRLFWLLTLLFWGPFLTLVLVTPYYPEWSMRLLGTEGMIQMEKMYGQGTSPDDYMREEFGSNFMMFAFYIYNNVGIDLRTFASGLLAGVGAIFVVVFNGAQLGAATSYVHLACNPQTFYSFVSGHSAPELMGIIVAGMAGMRLGLSLLIPGSLSRGAALVFGARRALVLLLGACSMTAFAAVIEGFWSANPMPLAVKYGFGALMWVMVILYLGWCGKERRG